MKERGYLALEDPQSKSKFPRCHRPICDVWRSGEIEKPRGRRKKRRKAQTGRRQVVGVQSLAPPSLAPSACAMSASRSTPAQGSRRHRLWRRGVYAWRWRQAQGPFSEMFPPRAYLWESFEKKAKNKKKSALALCPWLLVLFFVSFRIWYDTVHQCPCHIY